MTSFFFFINRSMLQWKNQLRRSRIILSRRLGTQARTNDHSNVIRRLNSRMLSAVMMKRKDNSSPPDPSKYGQHSKIRREHASKYQYQPLDPEKNEIRLIRVKSASFSTDTFTCQLFHTTLEDAPPYQALSYTWGDLNTSRDIYVNGKWLSATANLRHAIQRLRPRAGEPELILWVDAICINQEDVPERGVQTTKMRIIYQKADTVSIWLGRHNQDSSLALQFVEKLNQCSSEAEVSDMVQAGVEHLKALVLLFRRSYWWRIWVIQEIQSARNAIVYCGPYVIPWSVLDKVCDILKSEEALLERLFYDSPSYTRTLVSGGPRGLQLSRYSPGIHAPPLLELLLSHKSKKSTDPKDKVYALVGISSSRDTFGPIDYGKSIREIYTQTCRHVITTSRKLDVVCVRQHDLDQYQLPTWVPDWTRPPPQPAEHTVIGLQHSQANFEAAAESIANAEFLEDGYVLKTSGVIIDRVKSLGSAFKRCGAQSETKPALRTFRQWWKLFIAERGVSVSSQATFCRVISCGNWDSDVDDEYTIKLNSIFDLYNSQLSEQTERRMEPLPIDDTGDTIFVRSQEQYEKSQVATIISASLVMNKRRLFLSPTVVGLAPWNSEEGDLICVLQGCRFPVVLRRRDEHYVLIGEAYVDDFMFGEAMRGLDSGIYTPTEFRIH